ncbi:MAG: tRNA uracil 4-sulfurtransferase ThiI, partial [Thermofilaceae archaeon]
MVLLLRLGEITIKGKKTRKKFEKLLLANIEDAFTSGNIQYRIRKEWGRIFVYTNAEEKAVEVLKQIFGIKSISIAYETKFEEFDDLVLKAKEYFVDKVKGKRFAVRARRIGQHSFTSLDVEKALGAALLSFGAGVDLRNPEVTAYVEIRGHRVYFYTNSIKAYGGLPIGSEGKVIALVSGGFDSPVAAWYALRRGAAVHYLLCKIGGDTQEIAVLHVLKTLADKWSYGYRPKLYVVDFNEILKEMKNKCNASLLNLILKRYMYRAAEVIAAREGAEAIVTGESLGQASSQTLRNLYVSSLAARLQILRPLIGFDKDEIVSIAREIGTHDASARVKEYCSVFSEHPKTHASMEEVEAEEAKLDPALLSKALENAKVYDLRSVKIEEKLEGLEVDRVPDDAVIITFEAKEWGQQYPPSSIRMSFDQLLENVGKLDPSSTYVLVCDEGALSLEAAYILRKLGINA